LATRRTELKIRASPGLDLVVSSTSVLTLPQRPLISSPPPLFKLSVNQYGAKRLAIFENLQHLSSKRMDILLNFKTMFSFMFF
jgi:hypothetical protein